MKLFLFGIWMAAVALAADLPPVLIIGDSISIGYTDGVTARLAGKAMVKHHEGNAAHTNNGVEKLDSWLGTEKWKVITFNFGLHDLKIMENGQHQVSLAGYEKNMDTITARLRKTGARLIFVTTTPVPEGKLNPLRKPGDEVQFNEAALRVMAKYKVRVLDLYAYAKPRLANIQGKENVHFTKEGRDELAGVVAKAIEEELQK
ncbi:MAG TPA: SGNH/GDSL hydrolase family protein [Bryobacteraceae bacterium]|nr:SGNH/GDSL hydrolase family protein [Bryobacteraceae bacterium]